MQITVDKLRQMAGELALENRLKDETIIVLQSRAAELESRLRELEPETPPAAVREEAPATTTPNGVLVRDRRRRPAAAEEPKPDK
jgi:hypothetical protein